MLIRKQIRHTRGGSRGSGMVEGALTVLIVVFTLIGIVDFGALLTLHQGMTERVRAGARYGVVNAYDAAKIRNVVLYNTDTPSADARPLLNITPQDVAVNLYDEGTPEARLEVRIANYPMRFFTPFVAGNYTARPIVCSMPLEGENNRTY